MSFWVPIRIVEIGDGGVHIAVCGFVNGQLANILIDTGATQTVFDLNRTYLFSNQQTIHNPDRQVNGVGGQELQVASFSIAQFILGDLVLHHFSVDAVSLQHVNSVNNALRVSPIDLVLGGDFLRKYQAVIHYEDAKLWLTLPHDPENDSST